MKEKLLIAGIVLFSLVLFISQREIVEHEVSIEGDNIKKPLSIEKRKGTIGRSYKASSRAKTFEHPKPGEEYIDSIAHPGPGESEEERNSPSHPGPGESEEERNTPSHPGPGESEEEKNSPSHPGPGESQEAQRQKANITPLPGEEYP
ncbi:MAG: hypothetical protein NE330_22105 [Lentisphaeraceae bacterium]|nr:hypothetical protein [Lentisphaeraceae bacterium]